MKNEARRITPAEEIEIRFEHHPPNEYQAHLHKEIRRAFKETATKLSGMIPAGREFALVLTKLEEAMMWANAGFARDVARKELEAKHRQEEFRLMNPEVKT